VATLADEIETPGEGQVRSLVTVAGNPVLSTPDAQRLDRALAGLDFMVSVDIYRNETTRHADVILPPPGLLTRGHFDIALYSLAIRNVANYSPPLLDPAPGELTESDILLRLSAIAAGQGPTAAAAAGVEELALATLAQKAATRPGSPFEGCDPADIVATVSRRGRRGPERVLDLMLRGGPYGRGVDDGGLDLDRLEANPHGIDLGPLRPRLPDVLRTPTRCIELAPEMIVADVEQRLRPSLARRANGGFVLVGRRHLRSNNSWMHNLDVLVKGKARCTLHVHPDDASRLALEDGAPARVRSSVGEVEIVVEVTDAIMPGVVSIPHGWGHDAAGSELSVAAERPGVNSNVLADGSLLDPLSGNAVLNGIPVEVAPALVPA
jgi:anaerobic selenocysteine-containing dehydrogenase